MWGNLEMEGAIVKGKMKEYKVHVYDYETGKKVKVQYFKCIGLSDVLQKEVKL